MAVESPTRPTLSPLRFFNRTVRIDQEGSVLAKEKLTQIDGSLKKILSVRQKSVSITRIEEEQTQRVEKENKLEADKFFVKGVGKLANRIPGKNTIQKFLIFMAFGWLFNTFSKYFSELSGPLSNIIMGSVKVIDAFSKIAFGIFDGFVTFIDIGYKAWDVIRGTGDSQKLQSALDNVLLDIDSFFGGILSLLGIVEKPPEQPPEQQVQPGMPGSPTPGRQPGMPGSPTPGRPSGTPPSSGNLPRVPSQPSTPPTSQTPQAPPSQATGGIIPSQANITSGYGAQESFRKKPHTGIDYGYPAGTKISLIKSGVVVEASKAYNDGYGNFILIQHSDGTYSMFNHLQDIYVRKGQKINASQGNAPVIGTIGNSGRSTGDHLDFKVATKWDGWAPGGFVNPTSYQDSVFRIGDDVKVKPSQIQKLGKENGKEGVIINGQWSAKPWTNVERERYSRVSGEQVDQKEYAKSFPSWGSGTPEQRAMLDAISFAEGTRKSYGTVFGGKIIPELERGEMTVAQVLEMQKTGRFNGVQYIPKNSYNSDATGRYQFMSYVLEEEISKQGIPRDAKFTPDLQDKLILGRISRFRGVTPEILKNEGMSTRVMDMLAPEFASFPYSPKGNRSYWGQPVKSPQDIQSVYNKSQQVYGAKLNQIQSQSSAKSTPTSQASAQAAQEYAASKGKYYSSTTGKTYGSYSEALKDPEVQAGLKPQRWATDPRGWFGMKDGGMVDDIPKQTKATNISSLESYPSYSEGGTMMLIQPVIIEKPVPVQSNKGRTSFPVIGGVNSSSMNNFRG